MTSACLANLLHLTTLRRHRHWIRSIRFQERVLKMHTSAIVRATTTSEDGEGRFLSMVRDITEQLKSEIALETERDKAEMSSRSKSEFLANMSHEIRTPMTAILGFADLLDSDFSKDPMQTAHAIHTIQSNANHLLTIINDILDMSKIEAGKMTVEEIHISPSQIVEEAVSLMRPRAIGKGMDIRLNYETAIPTRIKSDPTRLR